MTSNTRIIQMPGLVDLQVNGYRGVDFCDPQLTPEAFAKACALMLESGATAFAPTMVTSDRKTYLRNLPIIAEVIDSPEFKGRLLGIHLEGPFISPQPGARGAHNHDWITPPDLTYLKKLIKAARNNVAILTIAAELDGAEQLTRYAVERGITVCLGHQMATTDHLRKLALAGAKAVTHLGNGVPAQLNRHENPIIAALAEDRLAATIITDGQHLPPPMIKTILAAKGCENCIVISDISHLAGLAPGRYQSMGHQVILGDSGRLYDPKTGYLAGSSSTMIQCLNHLASLKLLTPDQLAATAFSNPLALLNLAPENLAPAQGLYYDTADRFLYFDKQNDPKSHPKP